MSLVNLTDASFKKEVLESDIPVVVDFWAPWCGPCKMVAPVMEELAKEYDKKVKLCKLDVDSNSKIPSQYGIMSIPTLIFFKNGTILEQVVGAVNKAELKKKIEANMR